MYLFTFSLLGLFAVDDIFLKRKKYHLAFMLIAVLWIIFHDGLRWGVGTDWNSYLNYFTNCLDSEGTDFETGYVSLNKVIRLVTQNYSIFLLVHAVIIYSLIGKTIYRFSVNPLFSIFLFYCLMLSYLGMNRQYLSLAICIFSIQFIFDRRYVGFFCSILIASLFHKSAILFSFAYFLNFKINPTIIICILIAFCILSLSGIINKLPLQIFGIFSETSGDKLSNYSDGISGSNPVLSGLAIFKRAFWIILALYFKDDIKNRDGRFNLFFNLYFISVIMYILFNNTILQIVVSRGLIYFNIAEVFLIPYLLSVFKPGATRACMFFIIVFYGYATMEKGMNFYKDDLGVDIFRPYNSALFDNTYDALSQ